VNINCKISIGRRSDGAIVITVQDESSHAQFLELEMTPENFALALTGLALTEARGTVRNLGSVGRHRIVETREAIYPRSSAYDSREKMRAWLEANCQEDGWLLDTYLGSQSSVRRDEAGNVVLRYRVIRYADSPEEQP
jgi:hypothetical protein